MSKKIIITGILIALALFGFVGLTGEQNKLQVYFFDIGQGDATYIRTPEEYDIVIDGGPSKAVLSKLGEVMPFHDREIDVMILTHPHSDHLAGLLAILENYDVRSVYLSGALHTTYEYTDFLELLNEHTQTQKIKVDHPFILELGDTTIDFLYPNFDVMDEAVRAEHRFITKDLNNTSLVTKVIYKDTEILFTGDIESQVEEYLLSEAVDLNADVLKVAHHGSDSSSTRTFLEAVQPELAIISVGENNRYNHPSPETIDRFNTLGIAVMRTDEKGDILLEY